MTYPTPNDLEAAKAEAERCFDALSQADAAIDDAVPQLVALKREAFDRWRMAGERLHALETLAKGGPL